MTVDINVSRFSNSFSNVELLAILSCCIERAFRYDYEHISREIGMEGRTLLAGRGGWRTRGWLTDWILLDEQQFRDKYDYGKTNHIQQAEIDMLNKKQAKLEQTLVEAGFDRWISEFMKIYSVAWVLGRIAEVLSKTRPDFTQERAEFRLNISLESVI